MSEESKSPKPAKPRDQSAKNKPSKVRAANRNSERPSKDKSQRKQPKKASTQDKLSDGKANEFRDTDQKRAALKDKTSDRDKSSDNEEDAGSAKKTSDSNEQAERKVSKSSEGGSRRRHSRGFGKSQSPNSHNADRVATYAWKIYLAEITEEGVRMIDEKAAKELAIRCFELAVTFLNEEQRQS